MNWEKKAHNNELRTGLLVEYKPRSFGIFIKTEPGKELILSPEGDLIFNLQDYDIRIVCSTAMCQDKFSSLQDVEQRFDNGDFEGVMGNLPTSKE